MRMVNENGGVQQPTGFLLTSMHARRVAQRSDSHAAERATQQHSSDAHSLLLGCVLTYPEKQCRFTPCCGVLRTAYVFKIGQTAGVPANGVHGKRA